MLSAGYNRQRKYFGKGIEIMLETINSVIAAISGVLYQPWFVPLFLVVSGIYFTFRCKFIQIRLFKEACG